MKSKFLFFSPFLILCFFCLFSVGFSQETNWHHVTTLPVSNCAFSLNEANGNIYVIGGENFEPEWHTLDDVWIYDIAADSLSSGAPMPAPRNLPSGTLVNGKIYAIGGHIIPRQTATKTVEVYDIEENSWDTCASIPTARVWHAACVLDGKIYVMGGVPAYQRVDTISPYTLVERYDPETDTWDTCAPMPTGRFCLSACTLNGKIYAVGGYSKTTNFSLVEVYDPATDQWTTKKPMHLPRGEMGLAVSKGKIHAICGSMWDGKKNITTYQDFEVYDPDSDTWTLSPDLLPSGSVGLAAVTVNERIYVASGVNTDTHLGVRAIYMYDYPVATIETRPRMEATDTLHALIYEDCWLYIVPDEIPADPDSIAKYQIASWDATDTTEIDLSLQNIPNGSYLLYAVALDDRIGYHVPQLSIVPEVHEVTVQVMDDYTLEILSDCQVFLNGKHFVKESEEALNLTGWAYDTCTIEVAREGYAGFDTTMVVCTDTSFIIYLIPNIIEGLAESANQEIRIYPNPTRDLITVQTSEQGIYSLELINLSGQVIKHTELSENSIQVDLSSYQNGVYLVRVVSGDQVTMGRVMKY